jgi:hypothetical protein
LNILFVPYGRSALNWFAEGLTFKLNS